MSFGAVAAKLSGIAARVLGWRPHEFWSATPAELLAALAPPDAPRPLGRDELNHMMERDNG